MTYYYRLTDPSARVGLLIITGALKDIDSHLWWYWNRGYTVERIYEGEVNGVKETMRRQKCAGVGVEP